MKKKSLPTTSLSTATPESNIIPSSGNGKVIPMTPAQLRKYPGLEHLSDEEAIEDIDTLEKLAAILLEFHSLHKSICIDNQQFVYLNSQQHAA